MHVRLDGALGDEEPPADSLVREPFGDEPEHLALALAELVDRIGSRRRREQPRDDRRVDDRLALAEPPQRVDEHRGIADAVLEQVAGALGVLLEQPHREARLDVLGEHEHADPGVELPDPLRGDDPLVGVRRRHADVDDRAVGLGRRDRAHQAVDVRGLADDLDPGVVEHADDSLAGEHHVIGDDDSHAPSLPPSPGPCQQQRAFRGGTDESGRRLVRVGGVVQTPADEPAEKEGQMRKLAEHRGMRARRGCRCRRSRRRGQFNSRRRGRTSPLVLVRATSAPGRWPAQGIESGTVRVTETPSGGWHVRGQTSPARSTSTR